MNIHITGRQDRIMMYANGSRLFVFNRKKLTVNWNATIMVNILEYIKNGHIFA